MTDPFRPLKKAFGRFATGVALAGCERPGDGPLFITVNSFTSVSLQPPLVLWCLERQASSFSAFMAAPGYSISVLHDGQADISERFAHHSTAPLAPDDYEVWETGAPIFADRLAGFDCRVIDRHFSGDHVVLIAEVVKFDARPGAPLLYFSSTYFNGPETEE